MKTNIIKTGVFCLGGVLGAMSALLPVEAFAQSGGNGGIGWNPTDMLNKTNTGGGNFNATTINQQTVFNWVQTITTWVLGIAIVLFVLKVVLTAIDRMVFDPDKGGTGGGGGGGGMGGGGGNRGGRQGSGESILSRIPIIGAYDASMSWKEIWKSFAKNIAIVAGAWVLVQLIAGIVMFAFNTITTVK